MGQLAKYLNRSEHQISWEVKNYAHWNHHSFIDQITWGVFTLFVVKKLCQRMTNNIKIYWLKLVSSPSYIHIFYVTINTVKDKQNYGTAPRDQGM